MRPTVSQYARSLEELSSEASETEVSLIVRNLFGLLKRRGEEEKMSAILERVERIEAEKEGRIAVTVVLAHEADEETKKKLILEANKLFPGKKVELSYKVDEKVIGGAIFRTDETLYDATVSNELKNLKTVLSR